MIGEWLAYFEVPVACTFQECQKSKEELAKFASNTQGNPRVALINWYQFVLLKRFSAATEELCKILEIEHNIGQQLIYFGSNNKANLIPGAISADSLVNIFQNITQL